MHASAVSPAFSCAVESQYDQVVVRLGGEFDIADAPKLQSVLADALRLPVSEIVVDLRDLGFLDTSGVHVLLNAKALADRQRCELSLVRGPYGVHRIFELTGTDSVFAFDPLPA